MLLLRLEELTEGMEEQTERGEEAGGGKSKKGKVDVLQQSIQKIGQLQQMVAALASACDAHEKNAAQLVNYVEALAARHSLSVTDGPTAASSSSPSHSVSMAAFPSSALSLLSSAGVDLPLLDRRRSLYTSSFLLSSSAIILLDGTTGLFLDANSRFLTMTGWSLHDIVNRTLLAPYDAVMMMTDPTVTKAEFNRRWPSYASRENRPMVRARREQSGRGVSAEVEGEVGEWIPQPPVGQYPSTLRAVREVYEGKKQSMKAVWRLRFSDGCAYEQEHTTWMVNSDWVEHPVTGKRLLRPGQIIFAATTDTAHRLEE
jgi:PAS domain-containing protein